MAQSNDWRHRFAALMCIAQMGEGAHDVMKHYVKPIIEYVFPHTKHTHTNTIILTFSSLFLSIVLCFEESNDY
jgi:hypothetical protein